jgi:sugar porter (SP) family MFS transporter
MKHFTSTGSETEEASLSSYNTSNNDDNNSDSVTNQITGTSHFNDDLPTTSKARLLMLVSVAAATAATLGYDVGIMAAAIQPLQAQMELTGWQKEIAMGSLNFVAAFGGILGGKVADLYGRKMTISLCCFLFIIGTFFMAVAWSYNVLLIGRIVTGLGVGVAFVAAPSYITEVAPSDSRGQLNTVFDISINGGILFGYVTGFLIQLLSPDNWRLMLGCGAILPAVVLALLSRLPESPRWLMLVNQRTEAQHVLRELGTNTDSEIDQILQDIQDEIDREHNMNPHFLSRGQRYAVQLGFWQQITGTEAVLYYSADFLERAGLQSPLLRLAGNILVGVCKLIPECIAMQYIDTAGRRPLLFGSAVALFLTTAGISSAFAFHASPVLLVVLLCAVMASFSAGLGPFTFLAASENLGLSERAMGITACTVANRLTSGTVAMTAVTVSSLLGDAGLFALYAGAGFLSLFFYWNVPETAGATLEELSMRHTSVRTTENGDSTARGETYMQVEVGEIA